MLSNLIVACGLACGVALPSQNRSITPSRAITSDTIFNVGDYVSFDFVFEFSNSSPLIQFDILSNPDTATSQLDIVSYNVDSHYSYTIAFSDILTDIDYINVALSTSQRDYLIFSGDTITDAECFSITCSALPSNNIFTYDVSIIFQIKTGFEGFTIEALPYLTKVDTPYTPPAKSNLYRLLYDFYYSIFSDDYLASISTDYNMPFDNWLAHTCTIITLLVLIFCAFLLLRWIFKVVSGLILLKR